jgi:hypothetical protein
MKCVGYLLSLGCPFFCRSGIRSSPIAANDLNFRVGQQPGFDGLLTVLRIGMHACEPRAC